MPTCQSGKALPPRPVRRVRQFLSVLLVTSVLCSGQVIAADDTRDAERERYELMALFVETFQQIESNYVREVDRRELMEAAIQGMLNHLDQYSSFIPPQDVNRFNQMVEQEFGGIGITVNVRQGQLIVVSPLPGTPAYRAGLRAGDVILEVEGETMEGASITDAVKKLQGPVGRPVNVRVQHPGDDSDPESIRMIREVIKAPTVLGYQYNDQDEWNFMYDSDAKIGYIRMAHFSRYTAEELRSALDKLSEQKFRGLVLDLRFNPGGLLEAAIEIADMFLNEGTIVSVKGRNVPERKWTAKRSGTYPDFPLAVIINGYSASASEVLSACLQDNHRAVIIGERSWGKGSVQNVIRTEDGDSALKLTTAGYHRPSGANIDRYTEGRSDDQWGVMPDEGYVIPFDRKQWSAWDRDRRSRDILRRAGDAPEKSADDGGTDTEPFTDTQLLAAVTYISEKLSAPAAPAETASKPQPAAASPEGGRP